MMVTQYQKAKIVYRLRYRLWPWLRGQMPGLVVGVMLALVGVALWLPSLLQDAWEQAYSCEQFDGGMTCYVRQVCDDKDGAVVCREVRRDGH